MVLLRSSVEDRRDSGEMERWAALLVGDGLGREVVLCSAVFGEEWMGGVRCDGAVL